MIYSAKYVLPIASDPIRDGEVLVRGQRIEAVGNGLAHIYPEEPLRDLGEAILMPGFVNTHAHLDYTVLRGTIDDLPLFPWVRKITQYAVTLTQEDFRWSALLGAAECARAGITTVADLSFSGVSMNALLESGLRGIVYQEVFGYRNEDYLPEFDNLREQVDALNAVSTDRVKAGVSPHSIYTVSPGLLAAVGDYVYNQRLPISIHIAESAAEYDFCVSGAGEIAQQYKASGIPWERPGVSPVQYLYDLGLLRGRTVAAHCVYVGEDDISILAATRTGIAHCPTSNAKLGVGTAPVPDMIKAGASLGLGSDSAVSSGALDILGEVRSAILLQRASRRNPSILGAKRMIETATIGGARALGMEAEIGSIESGKKADLIAIDISGARSFPDIDLYALLAYSARAEDVMMTMVDGVAIYEESKIKTLDLAEIKSNVSKTVSSVLQGGS